MTKWTNPNLDGTMDNTLNLIIRLGKLWIDCDNHSMNGRYQQWNLTLDAIWRNLLYRDELQTTKEEDEDGVQKIIEVKLSEDDIKLWKKLNLNVIEAQKRLSDATAQKNRRNFEGAMQNLYWSLQMKDVGLRKFQHKLKLYVKEKSKNPSNAMWGG